MHVYCSCGFKNLYDSVKPRFCQGCGESLEPKATASHKKASPRKPTYEELPDEEEGESFDIDALRSSVRLEPEPHDNTYMTIGDIKNSPGDFGRGASPVDDAVRNEALGGMLNPSAAKPAPQIPDHIEQPRSTARRVGKLKR